METTPIPLRHTLLCTSLLVALIALAQGCSDSEPEPATPTNAIDSSYLDDLAAANAPAEEPAAEEIDEPVEITQSATTEDEERQWHAERGSKSTLGKARDRAKDLTNRLNNGTDAENGIASTYADEEYASAGGYRWDMPADWRMTVPTGNEFAGMYITNRLGNASVSFTKESGSVSDIIRQLSSTLVSDSGSRNRPDKSTKTIMGLPVTVIDMTGTYINPAGKGGRNESPFYAMHAVIFELPDTRILINLWGPEDTVAQSIPAFDAMIAQMQKE